MVNQVRSREDMAALRLRVARFDHDVPLRNRGHCWTYGLADLAQKV